MQHPFNNVAGSTYVVELHIRYGPTSKGQYKVGGILNGCKQDYGPPVGIHTVSPTIWTRKRNQKLVYHIDHCYVSVNRQMAFLYRFYPIFQGKILQKFRILTYNFSTFILLKNYDFRKISVAGAFFITLLNITFVPVLF